VKISGRASSDFSPLYHLTAYGIHNPWVQWAIEHGAYFDIRQEPPHEIDLLDDADARRVAALLHIRPARGPVPLRGRDRDTR